MRGEKLSGTIKNLGNPRQTPSGSEKQLHLMLSKISERKAALEQQMKDITMVQLELESAEIRCRQALEELNEKHPATAK